MTRGSESQPVPRRALQSGYGWTRSANATASSYRSFGFPGTWRRGQIDPGGPGDGAIFEINLPEQRGIRKRRKYPGVRRKYKPAHIDDALKPVEKTDLQPVIGQRLGGGLFGYCCSSSLSDLRATAQLYELTTLRIATFMRNARRLFEIVAQCSVYVLKSDRLLDIVSPWCSSLSSIIRSSQVITLTDAVAKILVSPIARSTRPDGSEFDRPLGPLRCTDNEKSVPAARSKASACPMIWIVSEAEPGLSSIQPITGCAFAADIITTPMRKAVKAAAQRMGHRARGRCKCRTAKRQASEPITNSSSVRV